jgi:hypothetical protein
MDDFANALRGGYRKRAFSVQYNLILLFGAAAFSAASASWIPLAAGGAAELVWLVAAPWFPSFRRWIDSRDTAHGSLPALQHAVTAPPASSARRVPRVPPAAPVADRGSVPPASQSSTGVVDPEYAIRAKRLASSLREIFLLANDDLKQGNEDLAEALGTLRDLSTAFERLWKLHQRLSRFVAQTSRTDLEQEITRLTENLSKEKDPGLRATKRQALLLGQRRLEQHDRIVTLHSATELRLDMIESAAEHVRGRGLTASSPEEFAAEIRSLSTHVIQVRALERDSNEAPTSRRASSATPLPDAAAGDG